VIALPPFEAGAVQKTVDEPFAPEVAVTDVGAPGAVGAGAAGVAALEGVEAAPLLTALMATTVKV